MTKKTNATRSQAGAAHRLKLYIDEVVRNGGNRRQAALHAGAKSEVAADKYVARMSRNVAVETELQNRLAAVLQSAQANTGISIERTLTELARIAYLDPADMFDPEGNMLEIKEMPENARRALSSIEVVEEFSGKGKDRVHVGYLKKIKFADKNSAIDKAMKHLGLYEKDNKQLPPTLPPQIIVVGVRAK